MGVRLLVDQLPQRQLDPYVPRALLRHLAETPDARVQAVDGTLVFADISGLSAPSEPPIATPSTSVSDTACADSARRSS